MIQKSIVTKQSKIHYAKAQSDKKPQMVSIQEKYCFKSTRLKLNPNFIQKMPLQKFISQNYCISFTYISSLETSIGAFAFIPILKIPYKKVLGINHFLRGSIFAFIPTI